MPDILECLAGLALGLIAGIAPGIWVGIKLYWKTGHW